MRSDGLNPGNSLFRGSRFFDWLCRGSFRRLICWLYFRMFDFAVARGEPRAHFFRMVVKRAHTAAISDVAGFVNHIEALGPSGVGVIRGVRHVVNTKGNSVVVAFRKVVADGDALLERFRLCVADVFLHVRLHLPFIGGMRFANVYGQKVGVIFVIVVDLNNVANLATEGRSSKAAEDEDEWPRGIALANTKMVGAVEGDEARIWGSVADFQVAAVHMG